MTLRLTTARIARWEADADRAYRILDAIERDARQYSLRAKGARWSALVALLGATKAGRDKVAAVSSAVKRLQEVEER